MVENIITIPKGKLQKGTITENGTYEDNNAHIRTTSVSSYAVPNNTAFLRCELDCEALKAKDIVGSFDGTTDLRANIPDFDKSYAYTTNANYKLEYYWTFGYNSENELIYAGYLGVRRPILGGNKDDEKIYVHSQFWRQSDGYLERDRKRYCSEVDFGEDTITYYDSGQSGTTYTTTFKGFVAGSLVDDDKFTITLHGERDSEFVSPDVAMLGYGRIYSSSPDTYLCFSKRWAGGTDVVEFFPDVPIVSFAFVFMIQDVANPTVDQITTCRYKLQAYAWQLDSDNKLTNADIALSTGDDIYTYPYPATMWYLDENSKLKNALLPEEPAEGSFMDCTTLEYVSIPESVQYIGEYAFTHTSLTRVRISRTCTYYPTSFPEGCVISYYGDEEEATDVQAQLAALAARVTALENNS